MEKTIQELNAHWWYRLLKIGYIACFVIISAIFMMMVEVITEEYTTRYSLLEKVAYYILSVLLAIVIFEAIRRLFYYVLLGTFTPKKK